MSDWEEDRDGLVAQGNLFRYLDKTGAGQHDDKRWGDARDETGRQLEALRGGGGCGCLVAMLSCVAMILILIL